MLLTPESQLLYSTKAGELANARRTGETGIYDFFPRRWRIFNDLDRKRLHIGDPNNFHFAAGSAAKERHHMRGLRDRWVNAARDVPNVEICVPDDPTRYCTITSFRLKGMKTDTDAQPVQHTLFEKHEIHTVWRKGIARGPVIRVTPGLYSTSADIDALVAALRAEHTMCLRAPEWLDHLRTRVAIRLVRNPWLVALLLSTPLVRALIPTGFIPDVSPRAHSERSDRHLGL